MPERDEISLLAELRDLAYSHDFRSFTIVMASGERYSISKNDTVIVGARVISVLLHQRGQCLLRQNHISEINISEDGQ